MERNQHTAEDRRFQNYVAETAFSLSLTKAQVLELGLIGNEGVRANGGHTVNALYRRGLVVPDREVVTSFANWELSRAGKSVFELLVVAGLISQQQKIVAKAA